MKEITLLGAGGKMGLRITDNLLRKGVITEMELRAALEAE